MNDKHLRITSIILLIAMALSLSLSACKKKDEMPNYVSKDQNQSEVTEPEPPCDTETPTPDGECEFILAEIIDFCKIRYKITNLKSELNAADIAVNNGNKALTVLNITTDGADFQSGVIELAERIDITEECSVTIGDYGELNAIPTDVFDTGYFLENYTYNGDDLGATVIGNSVDFKVWAPTASSVALNLFTFENGSAYSRIDMQRASGGVWSYTADCSHGVYYTYTVTTPYGTSEIVDPYAKAVSQSGERGIVTNLSLTNPDDWGKEFSAGINSYSEAIVWEVNVKEFSEMMNESEYKGKYLAFTESGLTNENGEKIGVDYLVNLGITHVSLVSVYGLTEKKGYIAPSADYAVDADFAITEFKKAVSALHSRGIGVIMEIDLAVLLDKDSSLNEAVPYYYCDSYNFGDREMFDKFVLDSAKYWIDEYDLDGLSFRRMGSVTVSTMQKVENAVHSINPEAIIYGDGVSADTVTSLVTMATHANIGEITALEGAVGGIAVLNNVMHEGISGGNSEGSEGYVNGAGISSLNPVLFGIYGGNRSGYKWSVDNAMVVNRTIFNESMTLWDKLKKSTNSDTVETCVSMNRCAAALLSVSKGIMLINAGEEMLRTYENGERGIDWSGLVSGSYEYDMMLYYKELIKIRSDYAVFTSVDSIITSAFSSYGEAAIIIDCGMENKALILTNPKDTEMTYVPEGVWYCLINGDEIAEIPAATLECVTVQPYSAAVFVTENALNGASV